MKALKAIPRNDCIFVLPFKPVEKTKTGLYLPEYNQIRPTQGILIAKGPHVKDTELKKGVRVIYGSFAPHQQRLLADINGEEKELYLMREADIIAVILDEKA